MTLSLTILAICSASLVAAAPQDLDALIAGTFGGAPSNGQSAPNAAGTDQNLNVLIDSVFGKPGDNQNNNSPPPIDINNTPQPPPINQPGTILGSGNQQNGNENCECVPYYQCNNGTVISDGVGLIDIRVQGVCEHYLAVCCQSPNLIPKDEGIVRPKPLENKGCGLRRPDGIGFRITGNHDNEAQFGEFPWMVAILKEEMVGKTGQTLNVYQCGGSLIHPQAVLTAAHCVKGRPPHILKVRAGEWDTQTKDEIYPHQDRTVNKVIVHEHFHSGALYNDYAILILNEPVQLTENVGVACLPEVNAAFDTTKCYASGWGKDVFGKEGHYQVIMKRVEMPMVEHQQCQSALRKTRLGNYFNLDKSFVCAGGLAGKDTCNGDGGSPLVCPIQGDPSRYYQTGIVAWGIGCGENGTPGVYGNVRAGRQWIDQQMQRNNLDISSYVYSP